MSNKELQNHDERLFTNTPLLIEIIGNPSSVPQRISREVIEEMFTKYALLSMGRSPVFDTVVLDNYKYAGLLILREIMHHLDFKELTVLNTRVG